MWPGEFQEPGISDLVRALYLVYTGPIEGLRQSRTRGVLMIRTALLYFAASAALLAAPAQDVTFHKDVSRFYRRGARAATGPAKPPPCRCSPTRKRVRGPRPSAKLSSSAKCRHGLRTRHTANLPTTAACRRRRSTGLWPGRIVAPKKAIRRTRPSPGPLPTDG